MLEGLWESPAVWIRRYKDKLMLSENLINQFTSDCPSTRILLTKAWPSLSVESKLQLLDTLKNRHPSWLSIIALDDKDEIVK